MAVDIFADDVRDYLEGFGVDVTVIGDEWIEARINNLIVPLVERYCRTKFDGTEQITEYYSGNGESILILRRKNLISIDNIQYVGSSSTYSATNYEIDLAGGIVKMRSVITEGNQLSRFAKGENNIKVTMTVGYSNSSLPDDIREAIIMLASEVTLGNIANRTGGGDVSTSGFSRSFGERGKYTMMRDDMKRSAMALLSKYMRGIV